MDGAHDEVKDDNSRRRIIQCCDKLVWTKWLLVYNVITLLKHKNYRLEHLRLFYDQLSKKQVLGTQLNKSHCI